MATEEEYEFIKNAQDYTEHEGKTVDEVFDEINAQKEQEFDLMIKQKIYLILWCRF